MSQYVTLTAVETDAPPENKQANSRRVTVAIAGPSIFAGLLGLAVWAFGYFLPPEKTAAIPQPQPVVIVQPAVPKASPTVRCLFGEYPEILEDRNRHPELKDKVIYVSLRHIDEKKLASVTGVWQQCPGLTVLPGCSDLFRVDCTGATAVAYANLTERKYPYSIGPGSKTSLIYANAYRAVVWPSKFKQPVVRGDWLAASAHAEPIVNTAFGLHADEFRYEQYLNAQIDLDDYFFGNGDAAEALLPKRLGNAWSESITRRIVESKPESDSLFVRWAGLTGHGTPAY